MAEVIKSIRASGGDYTTIAAWHSDLDSGAIYSASDDAIGELYNEVYSAGVSISNGATIGLTSITLRANSAARHTGTPGTGARVVNSNMGYNLTTAGVVMNIEWIEWNANGGGATRILNAQTGDTVRLRNCLFHNIVANDATNVIAILWSQDNNFIMDNCAIFDIENQGTATCYGFNMTSGTVTNSVLLRNVTVSDIRNTNVTSGNAEGFRWRNLSTVTMQNVLVTNMQSTAGTIACYNPTSVGTATVQTNGSDDTTSPNATLRSLSITFEDSANGDYRLAASDTDAIDAGTDLGTGTVAIDLLGRDRDAQGDTWDMGAFEFVASGLTQRGHRGIARGIARGVV